MRSDRRAFTLTEIAVVLGVIGLIIGVIWVAAASVHEQAKVDRASQLALTTMTNIKDFMDRTGWKGFRLSRGSRRREWGHRHRYYERRRSGWYLLGRSRLADNRPALSRVLAVGVRVDQSLCNTDDDLQHRFHGSQTNLSAQVRRRHAPRCLHQGNYAVSAAVVIAGAFRS